MTPIFAPFGVPPDFLGEQESEIRASLLRMLDSIRLRIGSSVAPQELDVKLGPLTVFVGPNNSGKSLLLREVFEAGQLEPDNFGRLKLLAALADRTLDVKTATELLDARTISVAEGGRRVLTWMHPYQDSETVQLRLNAQEIADGNPAATRALRLLYSMWLDGKGRLNMAHTKPLGRSNESHKNALARLYMAPEGSRRLQELTFQAFGLYAVLEAATSPGHVQVRLAEAVPDSAYNYSVSLAAQAHFDKIPSIDAFSDGVRAYVGILVALLGSEARLILVDEPEAFLHPPLARRLGSVMAQLAAQGGVNVLAATHSVDFLMGVVDSGLEVNVVRLGYTAGRSSARHLDSTRIADLMKDPLLRWGAPLAALFSKGAVVCEAETDVVFYQEINQRLRDHSRPAIGEATFLHAHSVQACHRIVGPLRELGVPAAAIVDLDFIKTKHDVKMLLTSANVPRIEAQSLQQYAVRLLAAFNAKGADPKYGPKALDPDERAACNGFIAQLARYGIFVVPVGELERWLEHLDIRGKGGEWLRAAMQSLGSSCDMPDYVRPSNGDVWDFIGTVGAWLNDSQRNGMRFPDHTLDGAQPLDSA